MLSGISKPRPNQTKHFKNKLDHYQELVTIAIENGGECLDSEYVASDVKMNFKCIDNHEWSARPNDVKRGTWCPFCRSNKTENLVRQFFETIFDQPFKGASPSWLNMEGERKYILDGLNSELKIAFEYHGEQHYSFIPHFHSRNYKTFEHQQKRDSRVRFLCKTNNVQLVEIKYIADGYSRQDFIEYMCSIFKTSFNLEITQTQLDKFQSLPFATSKLNELKEIARKNGGECLSTKFVGVKNKVQWRCKEGHEWEAEPQTIKKGHWCPYCGGHSRAGDPMAEIKTYVNELGGQCLSDKYVSIKEKIQFICKEGHHFENTAGGILYRQQWCPYCAGNKIFEPLKKIQNIAISKGGKCLTAEYTSLKTKMTFKCADNHEWDSTPGSIIHADSWCPKCAKIKFAAGQAKKSLLRKSSIL